MQTDPIMKACRKLQNQGDCVHVGEEMCPNQPPESNVMKIQNRRGLEIDLKIQKQSGRVRRAQGNSKSVTKKTTQTTAVDASTQDTTSTTPESTPESSKGIHGLDDPWSKGDQDSLREMISPYCMSRLVFHTRSREISDSQSGKVLFPEGGRGEDQDLIDR